LIAKRNPEWRDLLGKVYATKPVGEVAGNATGSLGFASRFMNGAKKLLRRSPKKNRALEIKTQGPRQTIFAGDYHSVFKGRGMNFEDVREYQPAMGKSRNRLERYRASSGPPL